MRSLRSLLVATLLIIPLPASASELNGQAIRFGVGVALLGSEQCGSYKPGPRFDDLMGILRAGAKMKGKQFDEAAFFARCKQEATDALAKAGKDLCADAVPEAVATQVLVVK